jgi:hypothetical protein
MCMFDCRSRAVSAAARRALPAVMLHTIPVQPGRTARTIDSTSFILPVTDLCLVYLYGSEVDHHWMCVRGLSWARKWQQVCACCSAERQQSDAVRPCKVRYLLLKAL